jgi:hypothetical protein
MVTAWAHLVPPGGWTEDRGDALTDVLNGG